MNLSILYEDKHILVVIKPAGVPSQKDRSRDMDMLTAIEKYLKGSYVGLVHRLDRPVSGIMLFAKTKFANTKLSQQIRQNNMKKEYLAVVCGRPDKDEGLLTDYLLKQNNNLSKVVSENIPGAKKAILKYKFIKSILLEEWGESSLLNINLITGRHHQIRVQLSNIGLPIWGDTKYNNKFNLSSSLINDWYDIALCAYSLSFKHPKTGKEITFKIEASSFPFNQF